MPNPVVAVVIRVGTPGSLAFQLRKVETGLSVFDPAVMDPPLSEEEILDAFRSGSVVVYRTIEQITALGLEVIPTEGADNLPERVRVAHCEIRPGAAMARTAFRAALKELEQ